MLIETLGEDPTVVAVGKQAKKMVALPAILGRNRHFPMINEAIQGSISAKTPAIFPVPGSDRIIRTHPLIMTTGEVHGTHLWLGTQDTTPPERPIAGAWSWNLAADTVNLNADALFVNGITDREPGEGGNIAESFRYIEPNPDEADALAKVVNAHVGATHCATWVGKGEDQQLRRVHFSARIFEEPITRHRLVRGLNINTGPDTPLTPEQQPTILAQQLLAAVAEPGTHRAIVNLRTLTLLKWVDEPMPDIDWEYDPENKPKLHPDDLAIAREMSRGLSNAPKDGGVLKTEGILRIRGRNGQWLPIHVTANLTLLKEHTTAALVTVRHAPPAS